MIENWQPDAIGLEGIQYQDEVSGQKASVTVFQALARLQGILMEPVMSERLNIQYAQPTLGVIIAELLEKPVLIRSVRCSIKQKNGMILPLLTMKPMPLE